MAVELPRSAVVVGAGYVGLATAARLRMSGLLVAVTDLDAARLNRHAEDVATGRDPLGEPGMARALAGVQWLTEPSSAWDGAWVFVCVGTPPQSTADRLDCAAAVGVTSAQLARGRYVVVRSTLGVEAAETMEALDGAAARLAVAPEFLREGHAVADAAHPSRVVVGTRNHDLAEALGRVLGAYTPSVPRTNDRAQLHVVFPVEAALVKLASNGMLALRAWFAGAVASACERRAGADAARVLDAVGADPRIGREHLRPGPGVGGPCLPKDTAELAWTAGFSPLVSVAHDLHSPWPWPHVVQGEGGPVAVVGVGFKPDSPDWRDSPAVAFLQELLTSDRRVLVADDRLADPDWTALCDHILARNCGGAYEPRSETEAVALADAVVLYRFTDALFTALLARAVQLGAEPLHVLDAHALLTAERVRTLRAAGARYNGRGRGPGWPGDSP